ncbi:MAG TPA: Eco57I restriction-modification methylase domain-containing protein [Roseiflexaceae bacterium]|nr:Eco57I restriction-modification methylase domain-containing protein [Roseiflexaceae bacterium]
MTALPTHAGPAHAGVPTDATQFAERLRADITPQLDPLRQATLGQYLTPAPVARLIASMVEQSQADVTVLDPGAGVGTLTAALVDQLCQRERPPRSISVTAYEIDLRLCQSLRQTMEHCATICAAHGVLWEGSVREADFIHETVGQLTSPLFETAPAVYSCAILNPPYRKINTGSLYRRLLRQVGVETSNLYAAFVALALRLLAPSGELVAITPRSFCNGPYFRPFRHDLLATLALRRFHLFESRNTLFRENEVLQENLIFAGQKTAVRPETIVLTTSTAAETEAPTIRTLPFKQTVHPDDPEQFIHLVTDRAEEGNAGTVASLPSRLVDLGLEVSTGRVVDFRALDYLRNDPAPDTAPLIYPLHLVGGRVTWPKPGAKKPNALVRTPATRGLFVPNAHYVLVKRLSSKEERRRVVATVYDATLLAAEVVGFENHLNYYHWHGKGLDLDLARGLAAYLNSTPVDTYFRQFNGHTQVNATDLRNLRYPDSETLRAIGQRIGGSILDQEEIDRLLKEVLNVI